MLAKLKTAVAAMAFSAIAVTAAPAVEPLDVIPADSEVVIVTNLADTMAKPVVADLWANTIATGSRKAQIDVLTRLTGVDIAKDIDQVVISTQVDRDETVVIAIRGTWDEDTLIGLVRMNDTYEALDMMDTTVHYWKDGGEENYFVFATETMGVLAKSPERLREAIAAGRDPARSFAGNQAKTLPAEYARAAAWGWITRPQRAAMNELAPAMDAVGLGSALVSLTVTADGAVMETRAVAESAGDVEHWVEVMRGAVALGALQKLDATLAGLARRTTVEGDTAGRTAIATTRLSNAEFRELLLDLVDKM